MFFHSFEDISWSCFGATLERLQTRFHGLNSLRFSEALLGFDRTLLIGSRIHYPIPYARLVKLVNTVDLKSTPFSGLPVQVRQWAKDINSWVILLEPNPALNEALHSQSCPTNWICLGATSPWRMCLHPSSGELRWAEVVTKEREENQDVIYVFQMEPSLSQDSLFPEFLKGIEVESSLEDIFIDYSMDRKSP